MLICVQVYFSNGIKKQYTITPSWWPTLYSHNREKRRGEENKETTKTSTNIF
jgi:hypothetical protein